jgi:hypothetical protein
LTFICHCSFVIAHLSFGRDCHFVHLKARASRCRGRGNEKWQLTNDQ